MYQNPFPVYSVQYFLDPTALMYPESEEQDECVFYTSSSESCF